MKCSILCGAALAALAFGTGSANAAGLLYSFETGDSPNSVDGFAQNGGAIAVSQSAIGVTAGSNSMRNSVGSANGFSGVLTGSVPGSLTPDTTDITLDLTINPGEEYAGPYADIGVTIFGEVGGTYGYQYQVNPTSERNIDLPDGTYHLDIPLVGQSPVDFSANDSLATVEGQGFVPTGFEFFYDRPANDGVLVTYIDNVQAVTVPEPTSLIGCALAGGLALKRRRRI
jgi:hypothetical protein